MKKIFIYSILVSSVTMFSCNRDLETEGISRTTYFPEFLLEGEEVYFIGEGENFTEPGITVLEQGQEIDYTSTYFGRYNGHSGSSIGTEPDQYNLTYSATNKDGFSATANRRIVAVNTGDLVTSIEGAYWSNPVRINGISYAPTIQMIWQIAPNVYEISCSVGGFYADGRGDGDISLSRGGTITVNDIATNNFSFTPGFIDNFGLNVGITAMTVDPVSKTITFTSTGNFGNGSWTTTMTQIQP